MTDLAPAKCPACGKDLMIDTGSEYAFCQYCGSRFLVMAAVAFRATDANDNRGSTPVTKSEDFVVKAGRLVSYRGESVNASIPSYVTMIGANSFRNCSGLKSVTIPNSVKTIENGAFIGADALILKGVTIGEKAVIGAGSVVTKSVPAGETWAGNPARKIRP